MKCPEKMLKNFLTAMLAVLLLLASLLLLRGYQEGCFQSVERFRAYVSTFGIFAPVVLILIQALQVILPVLPGFLACMAGVGLFGGFGGFWCNYIGISAGSIIAYFLARRFGAGLVRQMVSAEKYGSLEAWMNRQKSYTVILFLCILLPLAPDDYLCYLSGLMGMRAKKFIWIIISAKPWCILLYSVLFTQLF